MKVELTNKHSRKLKAVVGWGGQCLFVQTGSGMGFLSASGSLMAYSTEDKNKSLEELLAASDKRQPVYEGDSITLTF